MKILTVLLTTILLSSCADINVIKRGEDWDVSYNVLWRESEEVLIQKDGITVAFGRAGSDDPTAEIAGMLVDAQRNLLRCEADFSDYIGKQNAYNDVTGLQNTLSSTLE